MPRVHFALLFIIYINDLPNALQRNPKGYAPIIVLRAVDANVPLLGDMEEKNRRLMVEDEGLAIVISKGR